MEPVKSVNPVNPYGNYIIPENVVRGYSNQHIIVGTPKELQITFGVICPPETKVQAIAQIILTERHAIELIHNLQCQVNAFIKKHKDNLDGPPLDRN